MTTAREFDVVVQGSTGYTGRLVAGHLLTTYGVDGEVKWAMAGRDANKLAAVRAEIGAPDTLPLIVADAHAPAALEAMAARTKVVITTAGPYQLYGSELVAACAKVGTDYVDLTGESHWIAAMIAAPSGLERVRWKVSARSPKPEITPRMVAPRARAWSSVSSTSAPAPSAITKPSRPLANGREAASGGSLRVVSADSSEKRIKASGLI